MHWLVWYPQCHAAVMPVENFQRYFCLPVIQLQDSRGLLQLQLDTFHTVKQRARRRSCETGLLKWRKVLKKVGKLSLASNKTTCARISVVFVRACVSVRDRLTSLVVLLCCRECGRFWTWMSCNLVMRNFLSSPSWTWECKMSYDFMGSFSVHFSTLNDQGTCLGMKRTFKPKMK